MIILIKIWKIILETILLPFEKILKFGREEEKGILSAFLKERKGEREKKTASYLKLIYKKRVTF